MTTSLKIRLVTAFSALMLFMSIGSPIFASPETYGLVPQKTLPGGSSYAFKRLKEKVTMFFKFSNDAKLEYRKELLGKRLSEYVTLVENKNQIEIANASQRIAYEAGKLTEESEKLSAEKKNGIISMFEKYKPVLAKMRDNFPANSPSWLLSQQDIDTLNILSDKLK